MPPTEPDLLAVLRELQAREPLFHRPELGTGAEDLEAQMAPDFFEVGASGRCYDRQHVKDVLLRRWAEAGAEGEDAWETSGFHCRALGAETYLLTYTLRQGERVTRRVTAWRRAARGWQVLYHQGTPVT
ncbi:nuclear transport factor 2 family protein [Kineococcus indalonis]|uniref:nuclear transport factor 2 family protein n=1 Tax=Kineococcus indalonis TaxID=2696566 RepID=UPI001412C48A|nr:DUF4440 domain-containing protein [Kineococcus indalonis]NAZ87434.1 DUF4440 domain-containing protein [Kineococcus indalonis]